MKSSCDKLDKPWMDNLRWVLIFLNIILLGIWAVKETIALRNILLIIGTILSIYFIAEDLRYKKIKGNLYIWTTIPIILITCIYFWVIIHYLYFSVDPHSQFKELKSTWLRAFLASIIGLGTGLAIRNYPERISLLWFGILCSFVVLYYQYIPRAIEQDKLLVPDYQHYLFHMKINVVLVGMILIVGINGALIDHVRSIQYQFTYMRRWIILYWLVGTFMVLWAFVYIINTRNGIGLSTIMYIFWFFCAITFIIKNQKSILNKNNLLILLFFLSSMCLIICFIYLQTTLNSGWNTLLKDITLAIQIERYQHWQNPTLGYPQGEDGHTVTPWNYGRIAWPVAGISKIFTYPQGVGVLSYPFGKHPNPPPYMQLGENNFGISTHSGWVELGLAFGIPIIILIFLTLFIIFINTVCYEYPTKMTILSFVILITTLYAVGEVTVGHGLEILFYLVTLISGLQIKINNFKNLSEVYK